MSAIADGEVTALALCWRLERADGAGIAVTSHDRALVRGGIAHAPSPGIVPATITRSLGLEPDSSEISGALNIGALVAQDLSLGRWDGARARLTAVDWEQDQLDGVALLNGELGDIAMKDEGFSAELHGVASKLQMSPCPSTSAECRAQLGDKNCRVDLAGRSIRATIVNADGGELTLDGAVDSKYFLGRLRYLSGENCGLSTTIIAVDGAAIRVRDVPRAAVVSGCRVEIREGCDKRFATCVERFGNAINFRGEPHLPGTDLLTRYPGV